MFQTYQSKPIERLAHEITVEDRLEQQGFSTIWRLTNPEGKHILFDVPSGKKPEYGDYVVFIDERDVYHCSEAVFKERNVV